MTFFYSFLDIETSPKLRMWMNLAIESAYKDMHGLSTLVYDDGQVYVCLNRYRKCIIIQHIDYGILYVNV